MVDGTFDGPPGTVAGWLALSTPAPTRPKRSGRSTKSDGHGIGAFQTLELIRMSGGDLAVISKKGAGTTMRITLPLSAGTEPAAPSAAS